MGNMSLKITAANNIWESISTVYLSPDKVALEWKSKDKKVVGYLGNDIPIELFVAADCLPVPIRGSKDKEPNMANNYLENGFDPRVRSQMEQLVDGSYHYLDHLVVSNSSDAVIRVYYYLRALQKVTLNSPLPEVYFYDFLHMKLRTAGLYNLARTRELVEQLEKWTGKSISSDDFKRAIEIGNKTRRLMQQLLELRGPEQAYLSGVQAHQLISAAYLLPLEDYNSILENVLDKLRNLEPVEGARVFVSGSTHEHSEFYELVESNGAVIVGEDHEISARNFTGEIATSGDPLEAIMDYYHLKRSLPSSQSTVSERVQSIVSSVSATKAEGVIFFIHHADDAPSWDFPEQKKALERIGIPVLLVDRQHYRLKNKTSVEEEIKLFIQLLNKSKGRVIQEETK